MKISFRKLLDSSLYFAGSYGTALVNTVSEVKDFPVVPTLEVTAFMKIARIFRAFQQKDYFIITSSVTALAVVFLPRGRLISIAIDLTTELWRTQRVQDCLEATFKKKPRIVDLLDPKDLANAYTILEITQESEKCDMKIVEEKYRHKLRILQERKKKLPPLFAEEYELLIQNLNQAYATLQQELQA